MKPSLEELVQSSFREAADCVTACDGNHVACDTPKGEVATVKALRPTARAFDQGQAGHMMYLASGAMIVGTVLAGISSSHHHNIRDVQLMYVHYQRSHDRRYL